MSNTFNFLCDQGAHMSFLKETQILFDKSFSLEKTFY